jgi:hypothetical protein
MRKTMFKALFVTFLFMTSLIGITTPSVLTNASDITTNLCRSELQYSDKSSAGIDFGILNSLSRSIVTAERQVQTPSSSRSGSSPAKGGTSNPWQSEELTILGIGLGIGDLDGDGQNEIVIADPSNVYVYRLAENKLAKLAEYSAGTLEIKAVDVAKMREQGPSRIYVTAQNRGTIASFVLEYRNGKLIPVITDFPYYLRVINFPTRGSFLLGQQKGQRRPFEGPVYRLTDKGSELVVQERFGIPLKIPIFGFAIADLEGKHKPLIVSYDKNDHLRVYTPDGKRLFVSTEYYGGSDVILRMHGPEERTRVSAFDNPDANAEDYYRPRVVPTDFRDGSGQQILVTTHSSKTLRMLSRTKMLEEGQVLALAWNGDVLEEKWRTPKIAGMIIDFTVDKWPGMRRSLIVLERKKTDWLAFLRSRTQLRAYDLESLSAGTVGTIGRSRSED